VQTRLTLRPGKPGTKRLVARYGDRLVCVRYLYDEEHSRRLKTVELVVEEKPWRGRARRPRRDDHELVDVRIEWRETELRTAVKKAGAMWRPKRRLWEMPWRVVRVLSLEHRVVAHRRVEVQTSPKI
jgi:hypothetical protein